jgi:hypothetical protein
MSWHPVNEEYREMDFDLGYAVFFPKGNTQEESIACLKARDWCIRAKRAEEIQLKRGWGVSLWDTWHLNGDSCETDEHLWWNEKHGFATPIECILANEEWYKTNVETTD